MHTSQNTAIDASNTVNLHKRTQTPHMNIFSTDYMLYADACLAYMVTAVVCAVIRWRHMCHPYDEQADYFYPARRQVTFFYAVNLMQFPYYLLTSSLKKYVFYNWLINNILYLCVPSFWGTQKIF